MPKNDNQNKIDEIETIYTEYMDKIEELRERQNEVIDEFVEKMKQKKMEIVRGRIDKR